MNYQFEKRILIGAGTIIVLALTFFSGSYYGRNSSIAQDKIPKIDMIDVSDSEFSPFWKTWKILDEKYVGSTSTPTKEQIRSKIWGSIKGMVASIGDPYTVFFPPEESKIFENDIAGNFEGVGMMIGVKDNMLTVTSPLKNSPAEKAGVKSEDKIYKIDGTPTADLSVDQAVKKIRGTKGTKVTITVIRKGIDKPFDITMTRDVIDTPTIETEVKKVKKPSTDNTNSTSTTQNASTTASNDSSDDSDTGLRKDGIFIIRLFSFTAQSPNLFRGALRDFIKSGSHKLIIDLRGNPGGYLDAAVDMASWFLPAGDVIVTEDFGKKDDPKIYRSKGYDIFNDRLRVIILVNGGSASASEIFSGAMREHGIAKLVGEKTFGKGSVQELIKITPETSLKVTIARWLTPNGFNLSKNGLDPDYLVKFTADDLKNHTDPQLNKAIELLKLEQ